MKAHHLRGHLIRWSDELEEWVYADDGMPTALGWQKRPCGHCGRSNTPEGHDGCLGTIEGVMNACCGHGIDSAAYVQFAADPTITVQGDFAVEFFEHNCTDFRMARIASESTGGER